MSFLSSFMETSDERAMWRVQRDDDAEAFAGLMRRWEQPIRRLCQRMLGDEHKAEDITQEAFTRIYTRRKDYQHGSKFSTFLWRVAINLCLDELRRIKRRREFHPVDQESDPEAAWLEVSGNEPGPDRSTESAETAALVQQAVQGLPEHYRSVVVLRHYEDLKFREIAEVLEIPEGTVKSRMAEALQLLHQKLTRSLHRPPCGGREELDQKECFVL